MFSRFLTSALFAGAVTGLIACLLQLAFVQPALLHAELYESGNLLHFGADPVLSNPVLPGFSVVRDGLSVIFTMLIYTGYAMLLLALMSLAEDRGATIDGRTGLLWGVAGFVTLLRISLARLSLSVSAGQSPRNLLRFLRPAHWVSAWRHGCCWDP